MIRIATAKIAEARAKRDADHRVMVKVAQEIAAWTVVVRDIEAYRAGRGRPDPFEVQRALAVLTQVRDDIKAGDTAAAYRLVQAHLDAA